MDILTLGAAKNKIKEAFNSNKQLASIAKTATKRLYGGTCFGFNYNSYAPLNDINEESVDAMLALIEPTHCHLKVGMTWRVYSADWSLVPKGENNQNYELTEHMLEQCNTLGITVDMIQFYIANGDDWSEPIHPTGDGITTFFTNMTAKIMDIAEICDEYAIPMLAIVNENDYLVSSTFLSNWIMTINTIKASYPNLKLLNAIGYEKMGQYITAKNAGSDTLIDHLDYIGLNVYPAITNKAVEEVTTHDLVNRFFVAEGLFNASIYTLIDELYNLFGKKIIFTETGCLPLALALNDPEGFKANTLASSANLNVQYLYVKTIFDVFGNVDTVAGIYVFDVYGAVDPDNTGGVPTTLNWLPNSDLKSYMTEYFGSVFGDGWKESASDLGEYLKLHSGNHNSIGDPHTQYIQKTSALDMMKSMLKLISPTELINDGGFVLGGYCWTISKGNWDFSQGKAVASASAVNSASIKQVIPIIGGATYTLVIGTNTGVVNIYSDDGAWEGPWKNNSTGTSTFTPSASSTEITVELMNNTKTTGVEFGDISIKSA
jgi:hypothetical protein